MILVEQYTIPEKGEFEVYVKCKVNLRISAEEARRKVNYWLLDQVSTMVGAETPELVLKGAQTVWRVPAILTATHIGRVGVVGYLEVDVETGEIGNPAAAKEQLLRMAEVLAARLPAYRPRIDMPIGYKPPTQPHTHTPSRPQGNPLDLLPADTRSLPV